MKFYRLDKKHRNFIAKMDQKLINNIKDNKYTDFHFIRPYKRFKYAINFICNHIIEYNLSKSM